MFNFFRGSRLEPAIMKVKGAEADIEFANFALCQIIPGGFRRRGILLWRTWEKDADGNFLVEVVSPDFESSARKILEQLKFQVVAIEYGTIKPDPSRKLGKARVELTITYKGRHEVFDLSTE